jgi:stage V sporulation protein B
MKGKQNFLTGALILGVSGMIARFLGLFFRWPVTMLIGDEGIGLYQLAYPVYMFIIGLMSGFPVAISRMVAERMALGKRYQAYRVFRDSLLVLTLAGLLCSLGLYAASPSLIKILKWRSDAYYSLAAISLAPVFVSIMNCYRGYFQGMQMMNAPAASQVVEQLGRVTAGVVLAYVLFPYGVSLSAAGASFGACAGAVLGCLQLMAAYMRQRSFMAPERVGPIERRSSIMRELVAIAIPISIGMTVSSIMALLDSLVVPGRLLAAGFSEKAATQLYGQLTGKANVLINVPLTLSMALGTSLVPAISEAKALRNMITVRTRAEKALKVAIILGLPSSAGLFILADPVLHLIFPGVSEGAGVLRVLSSSVVFIAIAQTLVSILQGVGKVVSPVKNLLIGSAVKLVSGYMLTGMPALNIKGAAISSIAGYVVAVVLNYRDAVKYTYMSLDADKMVLRPLAATFLMAGAVYWSYNKIFVFTSSNGAATIISVITGIIVYGAMLILTGCISLRDVLVYLKHRKTKP